MVGHWTEQWGELPKAIKDALQGATLDQLVVWGQGSEQVDSIDSLTVFLMPDSPSQTA